MRFGFAAARWSILLTSVAAVTGCSAGTAPKLVDKDSPRFTCVSDTPGVDLPAEFRAQLPPPSPFREESLWSKIARTQPGGFAGIYDAPIYDIFNRGQVVKLTGPASQTEISNILDQLSIPQAARGKLSYEKVRWNYAQLSDWFAYLNQAGFPSPGFSSITKDGFGNSITIGAIDEASREQLIAAYNQMGIPCNLIRTVIDPPYIAGVAH